MTPLFRRRRRPEPDRVSDDLPTDPVRVLKTLNDHAVDYVVIGGVAVQAWGHTRTTKDVDLLAGPGVDNLARLGRALADLRARLLGVDAHPLGIDPTDPGDLERGANFTLATVAGRVDLWPDAAELKGSPPWPEVRSRAIDAEAAGTRVHVLSLDDLIRVKRAAGRPIDLEDIAVLTAEVGERDGRTPG